jgi:predicted dehydrogenase
MDRIKKVRDRLRYSYRWSLFPAEPPDRGKRVGLVGCGGFVRQAYVNAFNHPEMPLVCAGILSEHSSSAQTIQRRLYYKTHRFDTFEQMIDSGVDCVMIAVPNHLHFRFVGASLERGLDVLCEKPITNTLADANKLRGLVQDSKNIFMVGFHMRYHDVVREVKRIMDDEFVGPVIEVEANHNLNIIAAYKASPWLGDIEKSGGGVLHNVGVHMVNLLVHLFGMPTSVRAEFLNKKLAENFGEDTAKCEFSYPSGMRATLKTSNVNAFPGQGSRLVIRGERGIVHIDLAAHRIVVETQGNKKRELKFESAIGNSPVFPEFLHFYECIKTRRQPETDIEDSVRTIKCTEAARLAASKNCSISLSGISIDEEPCREKN